MEQIIQHKELGKVVIKVNSRSRNFVFRTKCDGIYVSVPPGTTMKQLQTSIEKLKERLLKAKEKTALTRIGPDYRIDAQFFRLSFTAGNQDRFLARSDAEKMVIVYPPDADFGDEDLQAWMRKVITEAMRRKAKTFLPQRLGILSQQFGLPYGSVKVNSSKGRWGSCSAKKDINLSLYLMLLPEHLIDYVLLHELCHTKELNHSETFWVLMDKVTGNRAMELRKELKRHKTEF